MSKNLRLAHFADAFPPEMKDRLEKLVTKLETEAQKKLEQLVIVPVDTGKLRGSLSSKSDGKGLRLGWTEPRAIFIDIGRIQSKIIQRKTKSGNKSKPYTRLLGSPDTPEGFTKPAIEGLRLAWEEIVNSVGDI